MAAQSVHPPSPASSNNSLALSLSAQFLIEYKPSFSMSDLKDALTNYLGELQGVRDQAAKADEPMPLLTALCEELAKYLEMDHAGKDALTEIRSWMDKVRAVQEKEEGIYTLDIPTIMIKH